MSDPARARRGQANVGLCCSGSNKMRWPRRRSRSTAVSTKHRYAPTTPAPRDEPTWIISQECRRSDVASAGGFSGARSRTTNVVGGSSTWINTQGPRCRGAARADRFTDTSSRTTSCPPIPPRSYGLPRISGASDARLERSSAVRITFGCAVAVQINAAAQPPLPKPAISTNHR